MTDNTMVEKVQQEKALVGHDPKKEEKELDGGEEEESAIDAVIVEEETIDYGERDSDNNPNKPGLGGEASSSSSSSLSQSSQLVVKPGGKKPVAKTAPVFTFIHDQHGSPYSL